MIAILLILFTPFIDNLNNEDYYIREFCHNVLSYTRPISDLAISYNYPKNCEATSRLNTILNKGWYSYTTYQLSIYLDFKFMLEQDYPDIDDLPWLPNKVQDKYNRLKYLSCFKYFVKEINGLDWYVVENDDFYYGLNDLRFYIRGLPIPTYGFNGQDMQQLWKDRKNIWRNK